MRSVRGNRACACLATITLACPRSCLARIVIDLQTLEDAKKRNTTLVPFEGFAVAPFLMCHYPRPRAVCLQLSAGAWLARGLVLSCALIITIRQSPRVLSELRLCITTLEGMWMDAERPDGRVAYLYRPIAWRLARLDIGRLQRILDGIDQ